MKAILEFNLPEETVEHYNATNGGAFRYLVQDILAHFKSIEDKSNKKINPEYVRNVIISLANESNLSIYE